MERWRAQFEVYAEMLGFTEARARRVPLYCSAVARAVALTEPICSTRVYADLLFEKAANRPWLAQLLWSYGREEVRAARRLARLQAALMGLIDPVCVSLVGRHKSDERRHVTVFHALAERILPASDTVERPTDKRPQLERTPTLACHADLVREVCRVSVGEFKNRFHLITLARAIDQYPDLASADVSAQMRGLVREETNHVYYSARVWEELAVLLPAGEAADAYREEHDSLDARLRRVMTRNHWEH